MNVVFCLVAMFATFAILGKPHAEIDNVFVQGTSSQIVIARDAGIQQNDRFVSVDGVAIKHPDDIVQSIIDSGLYAFGTVDQVRDRLVAQWKQMPSDYIVLIFHYAQMPKDVTLRHMETFMKEIKPALDEVQEAAQKA